jgi:hypothetical protein
MLTNPQFSFCLFIAGRLLLAHSKYNNAPIPENLGAIIASLFEISRHWLGPQNMRDPYGENLASGFARRLVYARDSPSTAPTGCLDIRQTAYCEASEGRGTSNLVDGANHMPDAKDFAVLNDIDTDLCEGTEMPSDLFGHHLSLAFPPLPLSFQHACGQIQNADTLATAWRAQGQCSHSAPPRDVS